MEAVQVKYVYVYVMSLAKLNASRRLDKCVKHILLLLGYMHTLTKLHRGEYAQSVSVVRSQGGYVVANLAQITRLQPPVV